MTQGLHANIQSEVYAHANRSDWPTELKGIFKWSPFELHPLQTPATAEIWLEGLGGLWNGVREKERESLWELQGVVAKAKL